MVVARDRVVVGMRDGSISMVNPREWEVECTVKEHTGSVLSLAYSSFSGSVYSGSQDKTMKQWAIDAKGA